MNVISNHPLLGGALLQFNREATLSAMAETLISDIVDLDDKRACMACLLKHGYPVFIATRLLDDARALAFQDIVAAVMSGEIGASA